MNAKTPIHGRQVADQQSIQNKSETVGIRPTGGGADL